MLKRERHEVQVGLVFIGTIILLILGLLWAKRYRPEQSAMAIHVSFPTVGGLGQGDEVLVAGLWMGTVSDLELREGDVLVTAKLTRKIQLREGYQMRIVTLTVTGEVGLAINPGVGEPLREPLPELKGTAPIELSDVAEPGLRTLASVQAAADTLARVLPLVARRTSATLDRLDSVLAEAEEGVTTNRIALRDALVQLRRTLSSTNEFVSGLGARVDTSLGSADDTFASLKATSDTLRRVLAAIDTSRGTLGQFIHDPHLYAELRRATAHLDSAAASIDSLAGDVRRNPKKYLHFSLF